VSSEGNVYIANTEAKIKEVSGWKSSDVDGTTALHGIACIAKTSCVAIDGTGDVLHLTINGSGEATASKDDIDGTNSLNAITCTGFTCATIDKQGNVLVSANGGSSWAQSLATGTDLTSVSCASSALCVTVDTTGNVTAFTAPMYVLSVFISGEGEVTSTPAGLTCTTEECSHQFEGAVTLTATPKPGYVLAGWLGCKHSGPDTCEIATPTSEVTAIFLKAGEKGEEGKAGKEGPVGNEGKAGATGPAGEKSATGAQGPVGPTGPAGKEGPAGKIEIVTCTKKGKKQHCTTKTESGTVSFTGGRAFHISHATLSRHGTVYAIGSAASVRGQESLRLTPLRSLRPGKYTLTLLSGAGKHETIRSESFTLS
jgi:Collagen triple helix repeat (20 copies)